MERRISVDILIKDGQFFARKMEHENCEITMAEIKVDIKKIKKESLNIIEFILG